MWCGLQVVGIGSGAPMRKFPLCDESLLDDLRSVSHTQPNLPHRVENGKENNVSSFGFPLERKVEYKPSKQINILKSPDQMYDSVFTSSH